MTREQRPAASPLRLPLREETPCGVTTNTAWPCQTNPIGPSGGHRISRGLGPRAPFVQTNPIGPRPGADQVPCRWKAEDVGRGRPTYQEPPSRRYSERSPGAAVPNEANRGDKKRLAASLRTRLCRVKRTQFRVPLAAGRGATVPNEANLARRGREAEQPDFPLFFGFFRFFRLPPVRLRPDFGPSRASGSNEGSNNGSLRREFVRNEANWMPDPPNPPEGGTPNGVQAQESPRQTKPIGRSSSGKGTPPGTNKANPLAGVSATRANREIGGPGKRFGAPGVRPEADCAKQSQFPLGHYEC